MDMVRSTANLLIWFILLDNGVYTVDIVRHDGHIQIQSFIMKIVGLEDKPQCIETSLDCMAMQRVKSFT